MTIQKIVTSGSALKAHLFSQIANDPYRDSSERQQQAIELAQILADHISSAQSTLDIAIYDFRLKDKPREIVSKALADRLAAGVTIRIIYDKAPASSQDDQAGSDLAPSGTEDFLHGLNLDLDIKGITGQQKRKYSKTALMHHKYILCDANTPNAAILMGSTNFTNDALTLQENNIVIIRSSELSRYYTFDFEDLWTHGKILPSSGADDTGRIEIADTSIVVDFAPGHGQSIVSKIVQVIDAAHERVTIASMLITSAPILAAISEALDRGVIVEGIYDRTQMDSSIQQIDASGTGVDRIVLWDRVKPYLSSKKTIKYAPHVPHDFMHIKSLVADQTVITGSFNFSNSARGNAENILTIRDDRFADGYRTYIQALIARYGSAESQS